MFCSLHTVTSLIISKINRQYQKIQNTAFNLKAVFVLSRLEKAKYLHVQEVTQDILQLVFVFYLIYNMLVQTIKAKRSIR